MKEVGVFAVIHHEEDWLRVKSALEKVAKEGETFGLEVTQKTLNQLMPDMELITKARSGKPISIEEKQRLQNLFNEKKGPVRPFLLHLLQFLYAKKVKIVPLESQKALDVYNNILKELRAAKKGENSKTNIKILEEKLQRASLVREHKMRLHTIKFNPENVIVGANHAGTFANIPHRILFNDESIAQNYPKLAKFIVKRKQARLNQMTRRVKGIEKAVKRIKKK